MVQRLFTSDTLRRIEVEQLRQKIDGKWVRAGEQAREGHPRFDRERANVVLGTRGTNTTKSIFGRRSEVVKDLVKLVDVTRR